MLESIYCFSSYVVVFEFLSLQTCIDSWAESLGTPSHLCPGGQEGELGAGGQATGTWTACTESLSARLWAGPVCCSSWGLEAGGGGVGREGQFSFSPSSLRGSSHLSSAPKQYPSQKHMELCGREA